MSRGGSRPGAGRKPVPSKAYTIRVPIDRVEDFEQCIKIVCGNTGVAKNKAMSDSLVWSMSYRAASVLAAQQDLF